MYSPVLNEELVKTLYRLKRIYRKPITKIAEELIQKSLQTVDKESACQVCADEGNNDCNGCYLADDKCKLKGVTNEGNGNEL
jgi:hypothetical protein